jgi:hypothetical protein
LGGLLPRRTELKFSVFCHGIVRAARFLRKLCLCFSRHGAVGLEHGRAGFAAQSVADTNYSSGKTEQRIGLFDTVYGLAWFAGGALMGLFYDMSILALVVFSIAMQLAALPLFAIAAKAKN